jgi:Ca-activated chloride channel homolog
MQRSFLFPMLAQLFPLIYFWSRNRIQHADWRAFMGFVVSEYLRRNVAIMCTVAALTVLAAGQNPAESPSAPPPATSQSQSPSPLPPDADNSPNAIPSAQEPAGQAPTGNDDGMFVFKARVQEVVLHATVVDEQRHLVSGLTQSAFSVFQDGVPQTITSFRREDVPVAMGIVIDNSGSMRDKRDKVNQAVLSLIRASNPRDEIFVVNFSERPYLDQDFTSDINLLQASLHQVSTKGSTALYDAIVASAVHLENNPRLEKKVLLVVTDGQDNMSEETLQEAARRLFQVDGPTLYAIGLTGTGLSGKGRDALQDLSDRTGGVAYFPDTLDQVNSITSEIAHDVRSQYIVVYKPKNKGARPAFQTIRVEAQAPGYSHLTVRTRNGYAQGEK